jgi:hypothetical protein
MSGPFPGMDPWLENAHIWQGVHNAFITYAAEALQPLIRPRFVAAVEARVYISSTGRGIVPDVALRRGRDPNSQRAQAVMEADEALVLEHVNDEISESYIEILDLKTNQEVVTVIELLSSSNKVRGEGQDLYLKKQREVLNSTASLIEIDLIRRGPHVLAVPEIELPVGVYDYLTAINRSWDRARRSFVYPRTIRQRLPRIAVPLQSDAEGAILDLQAILDRVYDAGAFEDRLDYSQPCIPRLRPDDEAWAKERVQAWQASRSA